MAQLFRSLLFVPGNNPRFIEKAKKADADIVCLDLEDSVPDGQKAEARRLVRAALESRKSYSSSVYVRTNSPASGRIPADLRAVIRKGIDGVVIPKVDGAGDLKKIQRAMSGLERARKLGSVRIIPSIESAAGVVNAFEIASFGKRVPAVVFGVFDLLNDIGAEHAKDAPGAAYSRTKIPVDARAAGVAAIDAIWQDLGDGRGLGRDCKLGKSIGYSGKSVIHPDQIPAVHRSFHPSRGEMLWAGKVCAAYLRSAKSGRGATTVDGKMIDEAHFKQARAILDLAK